MLVDRAIKHPALHLEHIRLQVLIVPNRNLGTKIVIILYGLKVMIFSKSSSRSLAYYRFEYVVLRTNRITCPFLVLLPYVQGERSSKN